MKTARYIILLWLNLYFVNVGIGQPRSAQQQGTTQKPDSGRDHHYYGATDSLYKLNIKQVSKHVISVKSISKYLGQEKAVKGKVFGFTKKDGFTEVYIGGKYPNHLLLLTLKGKCQELANRINGKRIKVIGSINIYKSRAVITVNNEEQIVIL